MRSIVIVTLYDNINIGNKLQNYAVAQVLKKYADNVYTLSYKEANQLHKDMGWKGRLVALLGFPRQKAEIKRTILKRRKKFENFSKKYLNVLPMRKYTQYNYEFSKKYDAFVVGSDQVWHNWSKSEQELKYFFLDFVEQKKRICLSPSFGFDKIPEEFKAEYIEGLKGFKFLSCREKSGCDLIEKLIGKKAELLIDPTMMLSAKEWDIIATKPEYDTPPNYILVYFLGDMGEKAKEEVYKLAEEKHLDIIDIFDISKLRYYITSPSDFLYLVKHADYIYTNSFHGCVFSILYKKCFKLYQREDSEGRNMSDRLKTLLDKFNIKGDGNTIDYKEIEDILFFERQKVDQYLDKCIPKSIP